MDFLMQGVTLFHKGGPVMYILLLGSLFVVATAIERFYYYRQASWSFTKFAAGVEPLLLKNNFEEARQFCKEKPSAVAAVAVAGIDAYLRKQDREKAMESAAGLLAAQLRDRLNYLSTAVTMAPLMGLLGTVVGMINSFSVFNVAAGQPSAIAGGVGEALIATATGLCVAMVALAIHTYFSQRLDRIITDLEQTAALLMQRLPENDTRRREFHEIA